MNLTRIFIKKFFAALILFSLTTVSAFAADTTYAAKKQQKGPKAKAPVNLYVPTISPVGVQPLQGISGQQFIPQINFQSGGTSGVKINTPYFERQNEQADITGNDIFNQNNSVGDTHVNPYEAQ